MKKSSSFYLVLFCLVLLSSCSGGKGSASLTSFFSGDDNSVSTTTPEVPVDVVEVEKLQAAIQAEPEYKIDNSELDTLKAEGIITDEDMSQLQSIQ